MSYDYNDGKSIVPSDFIARKLIKTGLFTRSDKEYQYRCYASFSIPWPSCDDIGVEKSEADKHTKYFVSNASTEKEARLDMVNLLIENLQAVKQAIQPES